MSHEYIELKARRAPGPKAVSYGSSYAGLDEAFALHVATFSHPGAELSKVGAAVKRGDFSDDEAFAEAKRWTASFNGNYIVRNVLGALYITLYKEKPQPVEPTSSWAPNSGERGTLFVYAKQGVRVIREWSA